MPNFPTYTDLITAASYTSLLTLHRAVSGTLPPSLVSWRRLLHRYTLKDY